MTPIDLARNLAQSDQPSVRVQGAAIILRGLTDDDGTRQGWPINEETARRAAEFAGVPAEAITPGFLADVIEQAPKVSDAMLNKGA